MILEGFGKNYIHTNQIQIHNKSKLNYHIADLIN